MDWSLPPSDTYFAKVMKEEGFEIDHLELALTFCTHFRTAVDGGAHVGTWSAYLATRFKSVYAFEPALDTFQCLLANTGRYSNVIQIPAALGARSGHCQVIEDPTRVGNTGSRQVTESESLHGTVLLQDLDSYTLMELDFLKLDVEGYELLALKGAARTIERCKPTIMVECKHFEPPRHGGPTATVQFLLDLDYHYAGGIRNDKVFIPIK